MYDGPIIRPMTQALPYKIGVLCYLYDDAGRLLLLHRAQQPNKGLYSPIGGKLHMDEGESPHACALREIEEEVELTLKPEDLHLTGMISETAYQQETHWLLFLYEVIGPVEVKRMEFKEGTLGWYAWDEVMELNIPDTDREVLYPLVRKYHRSFFHAHIDCSGEEMTWRVESEAKAVDEG